MGEIYLVLISFAILKYGDGAYDAKNIFDICDQEEAKSVVPPHKGSKINQHGNSQNEPYQRDKNIREIRQKGKGAWKENNGYHQRSLSETVMFRLKSAFGLLLKSRKFENQPSLKLFCLYKAEFH